MNRNIFISHSNKFIEISKYFVAFLKSRNLNPIVVEFMPNDLLIHLSRIYKLKIQNEWITSEIPKKTRDILGKLNMPIT